MPLRCILDTRSLREAAGSAHRQPVGLSRGDIAGTRFEKSRVRGVLSFSNFSYFQLTFVVGVNDGTFANLASLRCLPILLSILATALTFAHPLPSPVVDAGAPARVQAAPRVAGPAPA